MGSHDFELPILLRSLIAAGRWPRTPEEAMSQNLRPLIEAERVKLFADNESKIYLCAPPFPTVADEASGSARKFWSEFGALESISPEHSLIIGDFELGSDAPIILDYRESDKTPPVLRLRWSHNGSGKVKNTFWVKGADSFDDFAEMLGLI